MRFVLCCTISMLLCTAAPLYGAVSDAHSAAGKIQSAGKEPESGSRLQFDLDRYRMSETLTMTGVKLESPIVTRAEMLQQKAYSEEGLEAAGARPNRSIAMAMIGSAILPGAGQLYVATGSKKMTHYLRAPLFIGLDIWFWYGYKTNYDDGKDAKAEYEAFADIHWSEERFLLQHPYCDGIGGCDSWEQYNEEAPHDKWFFLYIPKDIDREEYYENIGKYDAFAFGWDDWNGDYDNFEPWTPNRTIYWGIRAESDDLLLKADRFLMALIINRVVSMLDAGWLAYRYNRGEYDDEGWTLELKPGVEFSSVGLSYRF